MSFVANERDDKILISKGGQCISEIPGQADKQEAWGPPDSCVSLGDGRHRACQPFPGAPAAWPSHPGQLLAPGSTQFNI